LEGDLMKENKIRLMLEERKTTFGTRIHSTWPTIVEAAGSTGQYDYIEFLAEYAPVNQYDLENIARAAELHDMATMIKVDYQNRGFAAQKALVSGFQAILFTDHHNADDVRQTLRLVKPEHPTYNGLMGYTGRRWIGYRTADTPQSYADMAARSVMAFMIEKKEAVEDIEGICQVPGVDIIQFGMYDYCMSCGLDIKNDRPQLLEVEEKVIKTALKYGVRPRCEINDYRDAQRYLKLGLKDFSIGFEMLIMTNYWLEQGKALRDLVAKTFS
jgi:2-keto-3-deoxy-L-rhamnonate aldolase RhmA